MVYQDLALCENLDIVQNMFLGRETLKSGTLSEAEMEAAAARALQSLSVKTVRSVRQTVSSLSGGQRQTVAIARTVLRDAKLVILDEPTEGIQPNVIQQIGDVIRALKSEGEMSIILVEQYFDWAQKLSDSFTVMRRGEVIAQTRKEQADIDELRRLISI
mgnify:CR=1 FL=1